MLREPEHEREFIHPFKSLSVRHFGKLSAGSETLSKDSDKIFQQSAKITQKKAVAASFVSKT